MSMKLVCLAFEIMTRKHHLADSIKEFYILTYIHTHLEIYKHIILHIWNYIIHLELRARLSSRDLTRKAEKARKYLW